MASNRDVIERHVATFTAQREAARRSRQPVPGAELVPVGHCPLCGERVPGFTASRRKAPCTVRINLHQHPSGTGWCVGSNSWARPALEAEEIFRQHIAWESQIRRSAQFYAWSESLVPGPPVAGLPAL